jgi:hypothetical protein
MKKYGLPLNSLKGVMLTRSTNLNWIECLLKLSELWLITSDDIYHQVLERASNYLLWSQEMMKRRLKAKVLTV